MKTRNLLTLALLPVAIGVLACEGREADHDDMAADSAPAATDMTMNAPSTFDLNGLNDSGVGGDVAVAPAPSGGGAVITINLDASDEKAGTSHDHAAMVHSGTCDNVGAVVANLEPVQNTGAENGSSTTTVDLSTATLMDGQHVIAVHENGGDNPGAIVACVGLSGGEYGADNMNTMSDTTHM
jgi:hypothetical protein